MKDKQERDFFGRKIIKGPARLDRCPRCDVNLQFVAFKGEVAELWCWQCCSRVIMKTQTLRAKLAGEKDDDLPPFDFDLEDGQDMQNVGDADGDKKGGDFIDTVL